VSEPVDEQARLQERAAQNPATLGTKLFVIFFMLIVPPLGVALLMAVVWSLWKLVMSNA